MTSSFEQPKKETERSPEQMETIRNFEAEENALITSALNRAKESGRKKTGFKTMAAFLALFTASTISEQAFAEAAPAEKLVPETQTEEVYTAENASSKHWDRLVDQINITFSQNQEAVQTPVLDENNFYKQLVPENRRETYTALDDAIRQSANAQEFFQKLSSAQNLSDAQKILALQNMGAWLNATFNNDMLKRDEHIVISDEKMFESLKLYYETGRVEPTGICGNIHTFMVHAAEQMGMEAWLQSGISTGTNGPETHIWMETTAKDSSGKKQIVFLDYGNLIPTGTQNYSDALGIAERFHGRIGTFNSFVGTPEETLFPVESRAEKVVKEAAGFKGAEVSLSERLKTGKITRPEALDIEIGNETKKIEFSKDHLALAYIGYKDMGNPYQSLKDMQAVKGSLRLGDRSFGIELDTTVLNLNVKDLGNGVMAQQEIINRLNTDFINSHEFNKSKYGQFVLNYGLTLESGIRSIQSNQDAPRLFSHEGSAGARLIYVNPEETGKFFIEATESERIQTSNMQNQELMLKKISDKFKVGGEMEVRPGTIVNFESAAHHLEYGAKDKVGFGIKEGKFRAEVSGEAVASDFKRFIPSSEKISAEIGYKLGEQNKPKGEVVIFGSRLKEHYTGQDAPDQYEMGVKMRIFLW